MMTRLTRYLVVGALMTIPGASFAQEEQRIDDMQAALERFKKAGEGIQGTESKPMRRQLLLEGRLVYGGTSDAFVERTIDAQSAAQLVRVGFREVGSQREIGDKTILGDKVYVLYDLDPQVFAPSSIRALQGERILFEVRTDAKGTPVITSIKKAN
jgi:hypothetical protein